MQMLRALCYGVLSLLLLLPMATAMDVYTHCNCDGSNAGLWTVETILHCQKISDFFIATAYFSIPLELFYFVSCTSVFPFKWVLFQFGAFIVLCGLTHMLNVFTYEPHSFLVMLSLTVAKFFTALVSFATAITLLTLIPQLLRVKVRENFLRLKTWELDRVVVGLKRKQEASWHVRMLTQEIRKSLDRHTILYTTLVELSKTLGLQNCVIWMPNKDKTAMNLTHELKPKLSSHRVSIPIDDADVLQISETQGPEILKQDSPLARRSSGGAVESGEAAAIRMPMLRVSNFEGGTPEIVEACYAILVLVLPFDDSRSWSDPELQDIVEVVAGQVAVSLSHAAVLEESQLMREKLEEQNHVLQHEKMNAMMASKARNSFQKVMSQGMRRPMHSILGLLSMLQQEKLGSEQKLITDAIAKTSCVLATLIDGIMESPEGGSENLALEMRPFQLHGMVKAAASIAKSLCFFRGFGFDLQVDADLPECVVGDEKRVIQVIMHIVGNLLDGAEEGLLILQVCSEGRVEDRPGQRWAPWKPTFPDGHTNVKFEIAIKAYRSKRLTSTSHFEGTPNSDVVEKALGFNMCKNLVQMMQGNLWIVPNTQGITRSMMLLLRFQLQSPNPHPELGESFGHHQLNSTLFKGLRVLLADGDAIDRYVTRNLLQKLGCSVCSVSSGFECINSLSGSKPPFDLVILDIRMPDINGFELAGRIRKFGSTSWPLILALIASSEEDIWERCLQSGMVGALQKPAMIHEIADELRRVFHKS